MNQEKKKFVCFKIYMDSPFKNFDTEPVTIDTGDVTTERTLTGFAVSVEGLREKLRKLNREESVPFHLIRVSKFFDDLTEEFVEPDILFERRTIEDPVDRITTIESMYGLLESFESRIHELVKRIEEEIGEGRCLYLEPDTFNWAYKSYLRYSKDWYDFDFTTDKETALKEGNLRVLFLRNTFQIEGVQENESVA